MDIELLNWIFTTFHQGNFSTLTEAVKIITHLGDSIVGVVYLVISILLIIPKKTRWLGLTLTISILLDVLFVNVLVKNLVQRPRPWLDPDAVFDFDSLFGVIGADMQPSDYSFPSGHTGITFCIAVALTCRYKWKALPAIIIAAVVALTRLYLCVHYPSDVVAAIVIGSLCGVIAHFIVKAIKRGVDKKNKKQVEQ